LPSQSPAPTIVWAVFRATAASPLRTDASINEWLPCVLPRSSSWWTARNPIVRRMGIAARRTRVILSYDLRFTITSFLSRSCCLKPRVFAAVRAPRVAMVGFRPTLRGRSEAPLAIFPTRESRASVAGGPQCVARSWLSECRCRGFVQLWRYFHLEIPLKAPVGTCAFFDYCNQGDYCLKLHIPNPARKNGIILQPLIG
jgi:hypothetical protein